MTDILEFEAVDLKTFTMIIWVIVLAIISIVGLYLFIAITDELFSFVLGLFTFSLPVFLLYSSTAKVIIDNGIITKKSILGNKSISLDSIQSYGIYEQFGMFGYIVQKNKKPRNNLFIQNFIYVSNLSAYSPNSINQNGSIRFHYNQELYDTLDALIKNHRKSFKNK